MILFYQKTFNSHKKEVEFRSHFRAKTQHKRDNSFIRQAELLKFDRENIFIGVIACEMKLSFYVNINLTLIALT